MHTMSEVWNALRRVIAWKLIVAAVKMGGDVQLWATDIDIARHREYWRVRPSGVTEIGNYGEMPTDRFQQHEQVGDPLIQIADLTAALYLTRRELQRVARDASMELSKRGTAA